jgi:hypothetical protein
MQTEVTFVFQFAPFLASAASLKAYYNLCFGRLQKFSIWPTSNTPLTAFLFCFIQDVDLVDVDEALETRIGKIPGSNLFRVTGYSD